MPLIPTAEKLGRYSVRYTWSGDAPFRVWVNGALRLVQTDDTELIVQFPGEAMPHAIEVLDVNDTDPAESEAHNPCLRLQWRGQVDASAYLVQRWNGSEWETRTPISENRAGYYRYLTVAEVDGTEAQWRVVAQDSQGYEGQVIRHNQTVVCNPLPPAFAAAYDSGTGMLTVEAA